MIISYNWLKEFIDLDCSPQEFADKITMSGLEVDAIRKLNAYDAKVGEVKEAKKAGKLLFLSVDVGDEIINVATVDKSIKSNDKIAVVKAGDKFRDVKIKPKNFGNFVSSGVGLAYEDFNLESSSSGLMKLDNTYENGILLNDLPEFNDSIIEIDLTPNMADALSVLGVARNAKAIFGKELHYPESTINYVDRDVKDVIKVSVKDKDLCPRYYLSVAEVDVKPSPFFIQIRLLKCGVRPINNVVDITNYVMLALGQPLHAFDIGRLNGNITVRRSNNEKILALDAKTYELDNNMLAICDDKGPIAIAGVMGGEDSSVIDSTKMVALEAAFFDRTSIRLTAKRLKMHTDASHRFERGVDPNLCSRASEYALSLLSRYADAKVFKNSIDEKSREFDRASISCSYDGINNLLGSSFSSKQIINVMNNLDFDPVEINDNYFSVKIPTYRFDIEGEADIAEEVARIIGYDRIEPTMPVVSVSFKREHKFKDAHIRLSGVMRDLGLYEAVNYSFTSDDKLKNFDGDSESFIYLKNVLIEYQNVMRTTLMTGLLDNLELNLNRGVKNVSLFEIGRVFKKVKGEITESEHLGVLLYGSSSVNWYDKNRAYDFYDVKGIFEAAIACLNFNAEFKRANLDFMHPKRSADVYVLGENIGYIGEINPKIYENYNIEFTSSRILVGEIDLSKLLSLESRKIFYSKLPVLPTVTRDLSIVVDKKTDVVQIEKLIKEDENIYRVGLFDVYDKLDDENKKSLTFRLILRNDDKTFTDQDIDAIVNSVFKKIQDVFDAKLRG